MARILIVDDSPTETFRFKEILGKHGFEVIEASEWCRWCNHGSS